LEEGFEKKEFLKGLVRSNARWWGRKARKAAIEGLY
jgi:hypothetical protein